MASMFQIRGSEGKSTWLVTSGLTRDEAIQAKVRMDNQAMRETDGLVNVRYTIEEMARLGSDLDEMMAKAEQAAPGVLLPPSNYQDVNTAELLKQARQQIAELQEAIAKASDDLASALRHLRGG